MVSCLFSVVSYIREHIIIYYWCLIQNNYKPITGSDPSENRISYFNTLRNNLLLKTIVMVIIKNNSIEKKNSQIFDIYDK